MAAARDRTRGIVEAMRAHRHAAPIGLACGGLIAGVLLMGNPFVASRPPAPLAAQPQIRQGTAELSLPEPTAAPPSMAPVPVLPPPAPAPALQSPVVPPVQAAAVPAPAPPKTRQIGGGRRAAIIVETLPAKPIIPPFVPMQPAGATPEPRPALPLDIEIGKGRPATLSHDG